MENAEYNAALSLLAEMILCNIHAKRISQNQAVVTTGEGRGTIQGDRGADG